MAPTNPHKTPRTKLPPSTRTPAASLPPPHSNTAMPSTKRDKRQIKHSLLLSRLSSRPVRVSKSVRNSATSTTRAPNPKRSTLRQRQRVAKKRRTHLSADLADLGDALPVITAGGGEARSSRRGVDDGVGLRTKRGYGRRLGGLRERERRRFGGVLVELGVGGGVGIVTEIGDGVGRHGEGKGDEKGVGGVEGGGEGSIELRKRRWSALRAHIMAQQGVAG